MTSFRTPAGPTSGADLAILGVGFRLEGASSEVQSYIEAFLGAYDTREAAGLDSSVVTIKVVRENANIPSDADLIDIHKSRSQPFWNVKGRVAPREGGRLVAWLRRGVTVDVDYRERRLTVSVDPALDNARCGEAVFHCCRSVAVWLRDSRLGNLLHASAVAFDGRAVLFCGEESSGKSTLFAIALFHTDAAPMASDRVLASTDPVPQATSWPGYVNLCEGTLLDFPSLARAAQRHESAPPLWRTQSWPDPLRPIYAKNRKRMYPMVWLVECVGRPFVRQGPIGAIVLPRVSTLVDDPGIGAIDLQQPSAERHLVDVIDRNRFDVEEPAFAPWHGLARQNNWPTPANLVGRLAASRVAVWECRVRPPDLGPARELVQELRTRGAEREALNASV